MIAHKRAEQAVQEALEYAESIVETVREPWSCLVVIWKVISVNHSFYQTFKVKREDTEGSLIYDWATANGISPSLRVLLEEIIPRNNQFQNFEVDHEFPSIGRKVMVLNARQIYSKGIGAHTILLAIEDITEQKKAEAEVKKLNEDLKHRALQLEAAYKELETYSYSVSHDLRTPLLGINGLSRVLIEKYSNHLDAKGQQFLNTIHTVHRIRFNWLMTFSLFPALKTRRWNGQTSTWSSLQETVFDELQGRVPERNLRLDIKALPLAHGNRSMIRQVFVNLLSNAIKFTKPRKTGVIEIGCLAKEDQDIYHVKDNGGRVRTTACQ